MKTTRPGDNAGAPLGPEFFRRDPVTCARELVWRSCGGIIVETEACSVRGDEACHTFSRPSSRAFVELQPPGCRLFLPEIGISKAAHLPWRFVLEGSACLSAPVRG